MDRGDLENFLKFIRRFELERQSFIVASLINEYGKLSKSLYDSEGTLICSAGEWKQATLEDVQTVIREGVSPSIIRYDSTDNSLQMIIEQVHPQMSLHILGAGHVGQALAINASLLGYDVTVIDDRVEFLDRDRFNGINIELKNQSFNNLDISQTSLRRTAVVIVTRGHQYDEQCLRAFINQDLDYIGMIGSKRRILSIFEKLIKDGLDPEKLQRVRAPIGLQIGARTPQEIAISILGEIIQVVNSSSITNEREQK